MIPFAIAGAAGRMGRTIIRLAGSSDFYLANEFELAGALEAEDSVDIGIDAGRNAGLSDSGIIITSNQEMAIQNVRVVIDFSTPTNTIRLVESCAKRGVALVIGTTGLDADAIKKINEFNNKIPILIAPNMSTGVNLLFHLIEEAAAILGDGCDIEITETHHCFKKDAPSGTAMRLKDILLKTLNRKEEHVVYGRRGTSSIRKKKEIGIHALRGGDTVGEHSVMFYSGGERIEITHRAFSRDTFAAGALRAAKHLSGSSPGQYTMKDVLEI